MADLEPSELLCIPQRRRLVHSKQKSPEGQDVLHVFYGEKEIIFDEPDFVPFGDQLVKVERFRAEEAMAWAPGQPYEWETVRGMLEALLAQDVLKRVSDLTGLPAARTFPATLGEVSTDAPAQPRTFGAHHDQCPAMTREAFGRPVDLSNLEAVVPVYRIAHPALDKEGRQVGENNVTPRPLFLDLPTERRVCNYPGSRYQSDGPMNVTALRHMTKRWPELLSLTEQFRTALLARLPARDATLNAGEVQVLTVCCLASVGYVMVRGVDPVPNGALDVGLAAVFRLIDGVRIVTTDMLRGAEASLRWWERPVDAAIITEYAERHGLYEGQHGVCAGPQALIDEYLRVLLEGASAPIEVAPGMAARLGDLDAALDYGLHGQRIEALIRVFGAFQGLWSERVRAVFAHEAPPSKLAEIFARPIDTPHYPLLRDDHPLVETYEREIEVNRWMFAQTSAGLSREARGELASLDAIATLDPVSLATGRRRLGDFLAHALPPELALKDALREALVAVAVEVFALERRCLRALGDEQQQLNARLQRAPGSPLTGEDIAIYTRPRMGPPLAATLAEGLHLTITTRGCVTVIAYGDQSVALTD
jgi:hypothetical protein